MTRLLTLIILLYAYSFNPAAAQGLTTESAQPIEVTAQDSLEWNRDEKQFTARGQALARQGTASIAGDTLRADYRSAQGSDMEIYQLRATGNVVLSSGQSNAYGDEALYVLDEDRAVLTGENLRLTAPGQTVTARDSFEYFVAQGRLIATGDAQITQRDQQGQTNTLNSDRMVATLEDTLGGQRRLKTLEAFDNVVIRTPTETVTGTYGLYNAANNTAEVRGNVQITRGPNILTGDRAEVDLNTNVSRLLGNPTVGPDGRVRGVFYPGS